MSNYRGATVQDLDLPPALSVNPTLPIGEALTLSYDRDYSQLTVISPLKKLLGYVSADALRKHPNPGDGVEKVMNRFDRSKKKGYRVITPDTELEDLEKFLKREEFAVVTDAERRWVLGVATRGDLEEWGKRRPSF